MADDDQQAPQQRYWFPYWTSPPEPAPRPGLRQQPSRRDTRPAQPPQPPPPVTPSPSRRQPQVASRGAGGGAGSPQQPQPTRLSSRPSPSRAHPLSPTGEPNDSRAAPAPASVPRETKPSSVKPATPDQPKVLKELDIVVPQEKIIHEPPSSDTNKAQSKAVEKEKEGDKEKHKEKKDKEKEHKQEGKEKKQEKEKEKDHKEKKEKEKEKDHKEKKEKEHKDEKEKEHKDEKHKEGKEKEHKEKKVDKDKHKDDESKVHGGKLHKELKAGVADMVHKLGATSAVPSSAGHDQRHTPGPGTTVITLAGENKGASMKVSSHAEAESKDDAAAKERRARKLDEGKQEAHGGAKGVTAFVNSNVQVVNNSLVFQSSCSSSDPGVHLKLSSKSKKKGDGEEAGSGKGGVATVAMTKKK